jgi:hypothetical protein
MADCRLAILDCRWGLLDGQSSIVNRQSTMPPGLSESGQSNPKSGHSAGEDCLGRFRNSLIWHELGGRGDWPTFCGAVS